MYTYKDVSYTDDQIKKLLNNLTCLLTDYVKKVKGDKDPEPKTLNKWRVRFT